MKELEQTVQYDVPLYSQGRLDLCWAFCEVMVDCYQSGTEFSQKDAKTAAIEIAKTTHGSTDKNVWNRGGWPSDMGIKLEISDIDSLYNTLVEYGPVYAYYSNGETAHMVVVTGVNLYRGKVYTNNPWGVSGAQSFDEFLDGFALKWWQPLFVDDMAFQYVRTSKG